MDLFTPFYPLTKWFVSLFQVKRVHDLALQTYRKQTFCNWKFARTMNIFARSLHFIEDFSVAFRDTEGHQHPPSNINRCRIDAGSLHVETSAGAIKSIDQASCSSGLSSDWIVTIYIYIYIWYGDTYIWIIDIKSIFFLDPESYRVYIYIYIYISRSCYTQTITESSLLW